MNFKGGMVIGVVGVLVGLASTSVGQVSEKQDWPQFRGPNRDGISKETAWNPKALEGGAKVLWKASVGAGWSSMSICGDKVFCLLYTSPSPRD